MFAQLPCLRYLLHLTSAFALYTIQLLLTVRQFTDALVLSFLGAHVAYQ